MNYYTDVLKKYAVFSGRARRKEFWMFVLWNFIVSIAINIVCAIIGHGLQVLPFLYPLGVIIPTIAVGVRRLHDNNHTGWWYLIGLIPFVGIIVLIVFWATEGQPGDNKYGPNPKGMSSAPAGAVVVK